MLLMSCKPFATVKTIGDRETLFDKLIAHAPRQQVPYPFSALLSYLAQYGKPVGLLVPLGRSLQRQAASFVDPRRIVGFAAFQPAKRKHTAVPHVSLVEFDLSGRLFLGYVENTQQIEVMSLLPGREVFDFQTVENYGTPDMQMLSHTLDTCGSCHQHGGPIFTPFSWEETNFSPTLAALLQRYHPQGEVDTIPIDIQPELEEEQDDVPPSLAQEFEDLVVEAANMLNAQKLWQACGNAACRAQVVRNTFAQVNLSLPPPADVKIPAIKHVSEILQDRFILTGADFNIFARFQEEDALIKKAMHGYQLSPAAQSIVAKIKKMPQAFLEPKDDELLQAQMISIFIEAARALSGEDIPHIFPKLNREEIHTVFTEVEKIITHVHRQDMHIHGDLDPQQARDDFETIDIFKSLIGRNTDMIFKQQLLLPANAKTKDKDRSFEKIELSFTAQDFHSRADIEIFHAFPSLDEPLSGNARGTCQGKRCIFKNFSLHGTVFIEPGFENITLQVQEFSLVVSDKRARKPRLSQLTFTVDGKTHRYDFLCSEAVVDFDKDGYLCSIYDRWRLPAVLAKLHKDKTSPLHQAIFDPVAIIKAMLAELGYDLKTYAGKIDWRKTHRTATTYRQASLLHKDVRQTLAQHRRGASLLKRCAGCHDTEAVPAPFLAADTMAQLCHNLTAMRDVIIDRLALGNMPPAHTSQNEKFSQQERQALLSALQENKFKFCEKR